MRLDLAKKLADEVVAILRPYCDRIEIAGSIRRKKPGVNDIDIVLIPNNQGQIAYLLQSQGRVAMQGPKLIRVSRPDIPLDVYIATPETWATLFLIRTGSKDHNIRLCARAKKMGMKLHADGSGLFRLSAQGCEYYDEVRIAGDTEESIFEALGLKYKRPEERD